MNLVIKDAARQIAGRVASAVGGFLVIKMITPYLGPLRFGDYSTILKFFAIWSAFADFGLYVIGLKMLSGTKDEKGKMKEMYGKIVGTRMFMIVVVYMLSLVVAYLIPAYTQNPYLVWGLPLGMLFSASFMSAGIFQTPLQLFWKMEQVSIGLILARIAQLVVLVVVIYIGRTQVDFSGPEANLRPFLWVLGSVLISGLVQTIYVVSRSERYLPCKPTFDRGFTKSFLGSNRQFGIAYYLSSFHTLIVLILLSIFYPTIEGFTYAGTRALGLSLIEILLIVPSSLGNSLIHTTGNQTKEQQQHKFGSLAMLVIWIGCLVTILFLLFGSPLITFLGGERYLGTSVSRGSDTILPYLGIVITLSFAKQVYNYLFISTGKHNKLLRTNLFGVVVGLLIGVPALLHRQLAGGVLTQIILESAFLGGAIWIAWKHHLLVILQKKRLLLMLSMVAVIWIGQMHFNRGSILSGSSTRGWIIAGTLVTLFITFFSLAWLKDRARGLR